MIRAIIIIVAVCLISMVPTATIASQRCDECGKGCKVYIDSGNECNLCSRVERCVTGPDGIDRWYVDSLRTCTLLNCYYLQEIPKPTEEGKD